MEERNFSKVVLIKEVSISSSQQIVINGVVQEPQKIKVPVLCCPSCGRVLVQFEMGTSNIDVYNYIQNNYDNINQSMAYCSTCGQKLLYPTFIEGEIIKEQKL